MVGVLLSNDFFQKHNPFIRHVVRRERIYLENEIDPATNESYLQKINVELHGESEEESLILTGYMKEAYELAEEFCKLLAQRVKSAGFFKTLLLKRIGSSLEAGKLTGQNVLEDVWIEVAQGEIEEAKKIIDNVPDRNPFEVRYNKNVSNIDWESCSKVLNNREKRRYFKDSW